jgi:outer membrane protein assembly factor BamB
MVNRLSALFYLLVIFSSCHKEPGNNRNTDEATQGVLYSVNELGAVTAFDIAQGKFLWTCTAPHVFADGSNMVYDDGFLYATDATVGISAIDARSGTLKWAKTLPFNYNGNGYYPECRPVIKDSLIYTVMTGDNQQPTLYCMNKHNGSFLWNKDIAPRITPALQYSTPVVVNSKIIAVGHASWLPKNTVYCFNRFTGAQIWYREIDDNYLLSYPFAPDTSQVIFLGGATGSVNSFDINTGNILWQRSLFPMNPAVTVPYQNGKMILLSSSKNQTACFDLNNLIPNVITDDSTWRMTTDGDKFFYHKYGFSLRCRKLTSTSYLWQRDTPAKHIWDSLSAYPAWQYSLSYSSTPVSDGDILFFYEIIREGPKRISNSLYLFDVNNGSIIREIKISESDHFLGKNLILVKNNQVFYPSMQWVY